MVHLVSANDLIEGDIFALSGLENVSDETKEAIIAKLIEDVQARLLLRIDDLLDDEGKARMRQLMQISDNDDQIAAFLTEKNINLGELTLQESLLAKQEVIQLINKLKE